MDSFNQDFGSDQNHIFKNYLLISVVHFQKQLDLMLIILNNGKILKMPISNSEVLRNASHEELKNYRLIGSGAGIYWPALDEDFDLDGYLQSELLKFNIAHIQ